MDDQRWEHLLGAVTDLAAGRDLDELIGSTVQRACEVTGARYGALGVIDPAGREHRLAQFTTHGIDDDTRARIGDPPEGHGLLGHLIDHPHPLRLDDLRDHPSSVGFPPHHPPMSSFLGVPVHVGDAVYGNLYLAGKDSGFDAADERLVIALAAAAGVAIANAQLYAAVLDAREEHAQLAVYADRDRIARDLHDVVIQRLFATGLSLDRSSRRIEDPSASERLAEAIEEIDGTIREIRRTIFELGDRTDLVSAVHRVVETASESLEHPPELEIEGDLEALDPALGQHVLAVVREGLANVARHARAEHATVEIRVGGGEVSVRVVDDGRGIVARPRRDSGLRNLRERAQARGGSVAVTPLAPGGTQLIWRVPVVGRP
ncbi:hypothetical protein BHE97_02190 [Aeromicrobium sp. PE09-221]|uniref:GAF domain-containing sensor histidine kinase n=1 Tax=Aeromicrobium sp. PE09-221 TaxID=1898043 RepID=UPI000B73BD78|nr:GAF domain-containing sensor histidine kinase [Aeromicrobium sp. PE09-221]OUZ12531.1 hypothetical protein BHE97_02190 [Aeromicrobium sp. PE09-221]